MTWDEYCFVSITGNVYFWQHINLMRFEVMGFAEIKGKQIPGKGLLPSRTHQRNTARRISRITLFAPFMIKSLSTDGG